MDETIAGEVIHVVEPAEHEDYDFEPKMASLADSRYVIVCRKGGKHRGSNGSRPFSAASLSSR